MASRNLMRLCSIAVCTAAMTSPASAPIIVKPNEVIITDKGLHEALRFVVPLAQYRNHRSFATHPRAVALRVAFAQSHARAAGQ
jgi:hypothetical protein